MAGLIQKGAISPVKSVQGEVISQLFTVAKKNSGLRPVVNLKALNSYIKDEHFKMEVFHMIKDLMKQGDWMEKVDLKKAYFLIPIYPGHQKHHFWCISVLLSPVQSVMCTQGIQISNETSRSLPEERDV